MQFCTDISLSLEDPALLALSYTLSSTQMGVFTRQGWTDGWRGMKCDSLEGMREGVASLKRRLESGGKAGLTSSSSGGEEGDAQWFKSVYMYAFTFTLAPGQRSMPVENAKAFWEMLLPLTAVGEGDTKDGWKAEQTEWWFEFLDEKRTKGISKDAWGMVSVLPSF